MKWLIRGFDKIRRPFAWTVFFVGLIGMLATFFNIIVTGDAKWATLVVFFMLAADGFSEVSDIEE